MPPASSLRLVGLLLLIVGLFRSRATGLLNLLCESAAGGRHPLCTSLVIDTVGLPTLLHERVTASLPNLLHERSFAGLPNLLWSRCRATSPAMHHTPAVAYQASDGGSLQENTWRRENSDGRGVQLCSPFFCGGCWSQIVLSTPVKSTYGVALGAAGDNLSRNSAYWHVMTWIILSVM
jgi:hypothetical protein